jgi:hypothetical protein
MSYTRMVDGVEVPMTAEEIAERQAEEALPPEPEPLYTRVAQAFGSLSLDLQTKYKDQIRDSAFFFINNNYPMLAVVIAEAEAMYSLPDDQPVKDIIDAAKVELGL